jgi:hypothetical protein
MIWTRDCSFATRWVPRSRCTSHAGRKLQTGQTHRDAFDRWQEVVRLLFLDRLDRLDRLERFPPATIMLSRMACNNFSSWGVRGVEECLLNSICLFLDYKPATASVPNFSR